MFLLLDLVTAPYTLEALRVWLMSLLAILETAVHLLMCATT